MAGSSAIKAGEAFVQLFVEDNMLYRALDKAGAKFKAWGGSLTRIGAELGGAGRGILSPLVDSLKEVLDRATKLQLFSDRIGESITSLSVLEAGFEHAGASAGSFESSIEALRIRISEAADTNDVLMKSLISLGTGMQLEGMSTKDLLYSISDAIERIPDPIRKLRALKGLGLPPEVLAALKQGRKGVDELIKDGQDFALSPEQGSQSVAITTAIRKGWLDLKATFQEVGLALLPTAAEIAQLSTDFREGLKSVRAWIRENRAAVVGVAALGISLVAGGAALVGLGTVAAAVGAGIVAVVAVVKLAFAALLSPIGLVVAGVGLVGYVLATKTEAGRKAVSDLKGEFSSLLGRVLETWGGISDALEAGDMGLAFKIALAGMKAEWDTFGMYFDAGTDAFIDHFVDGWRDANQQVAKEVRNLLVMFKDAFSILLGIPKQAIDEFIAGMDEQIAARDKERNKDNKARNDKMNEGLNKANKSKKELADLKHEAANRKTEKRWGDIFRGGLGAIAGLFPEGATRRPAMRGLAEHVKGVMGGANSTIVGQQLGYGDNIPAQQLDQLRALNIAAAQLPQMAQDINAIARTGGRFT